MALERVAPERRRQKRRARRVIEVHPTAEWLRAAAEEASATPPPLQEQRGRPGSARELANVEANLVPLLARDRWRRDERKRTFM